MGTVVTLRRSLMRLKPETDPADVHQMAGAGKQRDRLAVLEAGRGDDEVVEMAGSHPGIVGDVGVARLHPLKREMRDEMLDRLGHGIDVARRPRHGLRRDGLRPRHAAHITMGPRSHPETIPIQVATGPSPV